MTILRLKYIILDSVNQTGSYKSKENGPNLFGRLTYTEYNEVNNFLDWVSDNNLTFGSGNYEEIVLLYNKIK